MAERNIGKVKFDLEELRLVDRDAVKFLDVCELSGIKLANCARYVRDWIARQQSGK